MLRSEFSLCSVCEHLAKDAKPAVALPSVHTAILQCVVDTFAAVSDWKSITGNGAQSAVGVDAVFVIVDTQTEASLKDSSAS